jgi:aminopeptidase N
MRTVVRSWLLVAMLFAAHVHAQPRFAFDATPGSLAKDVVPSEYSLALSLDPAKDTFTGVVDIAVNVRRRVDAIVVNAFDLTAGEVTLGSSAATRSMTVTSDKAKRQWRIADGRAVEAGQYRLRIAYTGAVRSYGEGLFGVSYTALGKPARMLATQMEPIAARAVFPGFDEPSFRARFEISVAAPSAYEVVSNMPVSMRDAQGEVTRWRFAPTPPMPSYLVAVAVGQFDALEDVVDAVPLRILTAKGKLEEARYAMSATKQILPYYREYFGIPFALPKLDQLAVPGVRGGAMEDWGDISYSESILLYDPAKSSSDTKQWIFEVIAHEVAHQWFGDLVTAASWDEIWLNEAFATWMSNKATARFNPDWQIPLTSILWRQEGHAQRRRASHARSGRARSSRPRYSTSSTVLPTPRVAPCSICSNSATGPEVFRRGPGRVFRRPEVLQRHRRRPVALPGAGVGNRCRRHRPKLDGPARLPFLQARISCDGQADARLEQRRFSTDGAVDATSL